jgi:hypothetical protein
LSALPDWLEPAALAYLQWGGAVVVLLVVLALYAHVRHETRRRGRR